MLNQTAKTVRKLQANTDTYTKISNSFKTAFQTTPLPLYVRAAFHDAGTFDKYTNTGGPNGSLFNAAEEIRFENFGISTIKDVIVNIKNENSTVSLADIIQIGGYVAISETGGPNMKFRFGRIDVGTADNDTDGRLPFPASKNLRAIFYNMGFNDKEIVAISGAHTLGGVRFVIPGSTAPLKPFTNNPLVFDNSYFKLLLQTQQPTLARLASDLYLVQDAAFLNWVQQFANDQNLFFQEYSKAHIKLSELGYN